jgi:preprotein translocase subunit SecY
MPQLLMMLVLFVVVIAGIIMVTQGQRKIPVQYAKRVVGQKVYGGQSSFLPLKVNYSGVMPVIFAQAILLFPQQILSQLGAAFNLKFLSEFSSNLLRGHWLYYSGYTVLILFFSYFWVSVMFKPIQIADDLKKYGGYIPGVRPGEPTAKFLDFIMTRLTLAGAIFLTVIAVMPDVLLYELKVPQRIAYFFGGTGMLITVGVLLDFSAATPLRRFLAQRSDPCPQYRHGLRNRRGCRYSYRQGPRPAAGGYLPGGDHLLDYPPLGSLRLYFLGNACHSPHLSAVRPHGRREVVMLQCPRHASRELGQ